MTGKDVRKALKVPAETSASYEVGYRKPPAEHRFKPGKSGNPNGRPKGTKNMKRELCEGRLQDSILDEGSRTISVQEGGRTLSFSMVQAIARSLSVNAAKGQPRSQKLFMELFAKAAAAKIKDHLEMLSLASDYKNKWESILEKRRRTGSTGPEPIPHPDDVVIDDVTGEVTFKGPCTKAQNERLRFLLDRERAFEKEAEGLERRRAKCADPTQRRFLEEERDRAWGNVEEFRDIIDICWAKAHLVLERLREEHGEDMVRRAQIIGVSLSRRDGPRG